MSTESNAPDPYETVLADLRAKRLQIDHAIAAIEGILGKGSGASAAIPVSQSSDSGIIETSGMYLGMSIVDATKKLLALRKRTMGNVEIAKELRAGGLALTGAEPANVVGSVLSRRFIQVGDVVKVGRGIWGLKEWYPGRNFKPGGKASSGAGEPAPPQEFSEVEGRIFGFPPAKPIPTE